MLIEDGKVSKRLKEMSGTKLKIVVVEPWEFYPYVVYAEVHHWDDETGFAIVKLDSSVLFKGQNCQFFRMEAIQKTSTVKDVKSGKLVDCSLILLDESSIEPKAKKFLAGWKNQIGLRASVEMVKKDD